MPNANLDVCSSLAEVRAHIDALDAELVKLLALRSGYVAQAAHFKKDTAAVRAPARVEQVVARAKALAFEQGAPESVVEAVYRAMIDAFIQEELAAHARLQHSPSEELE